MNRVMLVGRITRDPELRTSPNGVSFTAFSIAVNRQFANAQGERVADFINCVAFNKQAENLARYIKKGGLIGVEGKLQTRTYQAQDGSNRTAVEVICDVITFLESRSSNQQPGGYNDYSSYDGSYNQPEQNSSPRNGYVAPRRPEPVQPAPVQPAPVQKEEPSSFTDVEQQFDISDDDLPF